MMGDNKSEKFFKVLHDRMKEAQTDIKATVSVNVGEMTHKANEKDLENGEAQFKTCLKNLLFLQFHRTPLPVCLFIDGLFYYSVRGFCFYCLLMCVMCVTLRKFFMKCYDPILEKFHLWMISSPNALLYMMHKGAVCQCYPSELIFPPPLCTGGTTALVLPGAGGHQLLVQGQSIAPITGASALPVQPVAEQREVEMEMGPAVTIMKPILRFLQLLCENHNHDLQVRFY